MGGLSRPQQSRPLVLMASGSWVRQVVSMECHYQSVTHARHGSLPTPRARRPAASPSVTIDPGLV